MSSPKPKGTPSPVLLPFPIASPKPQTPATPPGVPVPYPNVSMKPDGGPKPPPPVGPKAQAVKGLHAPVPYAPSWQTGSGFSFALQRPQSCGDERAKVANLRKLITSHEAKIAEIERFKDKQDFVNGAMLVTAVILETSIGFLDMAAKALKPINKQAAAVAEGGLLAIEAAGTASQVAHGQRSAGSAMAHMADKTVDTAFAVADPGTIQGKMILSTAKLKYDSTVIVVKAAMGADTASIKKDSVDMVKDRSKSIAGMVEDGLKDQDYARAGKAIEGLVIVAEMYEAGVKYQNALDSRMNDYFSHKEWVDSYVMDEKLRLLKLIGGFKKDLHTAVAALEACEAMG